MILPAPITSRSNARVKELRAALSGKASRAGDLLGLEGEHLVEEARRSGGSFETVYLRQGSQGKLAQGWLGSLRARAWAVLTGEVFDSAISTNTPQGIAATWSIQPVPGPVSARGVALVLESLQDPGNLGTLIRTAEAFGAEQIFVTPNTANEWNPKALRASAGSVFRLPVIRASAGEIRERLRGARLFAAVAGSTAAAAVSAFDAVFTAPCALMVGNEGAGLSQEALDIADACVHIPCAAESLNAAVAGSVLLYEAARQGAMRTLESAR